MYLVHTHTHCVCAWVGVGGQVKEMRKDESGRDYEVWKVAYLLEVRPRMHVAQLVHSHTRQSTISHKMHTKMCLTCWRSDSHEEGVGGDAVSP
jgi:hypothetical protein